MAFEKLQRRTWRWGIATVFTVAIALSAVTAYAVNDGDQFEGTTAPGGHEWHQDLQSAQFCGNCHQGVMADLEAGPHQSAQLSLCVLCHPPQAEDADGHAARVARCSDCHGYSSPIEPHIGPSDCNVCHAVHGPLYGGAVEQLKSDAHAGIRDDLGELDDADVSKTCLACHTHVAINIDVTLNPPLDLQMGD